MNFMSCFLIEPSKVQGNIWKRTAKSSNSNSKTSEEIQTALQSTQIPERNLKLHIKCSECICQTTPLSLESLAVPYQVVHCFIVPKHAHIALWVILNILKCDRATQWPDNILETVETNFLPSLWPSNQGRRETFGSMEWKIYQCL
jgi:hypothetical protein